MDPRPFRDDILTSVCGCSLRISHPVEDSAFSQRVFGLAKNIVVPYMIYTQESLRIESGI